MDERIWITKKDATNLAVCEKEQPGPEKMFVIDVIRPGYVCKKPGYMKRPFGSGLYDITRLEDGLHFSRIGSDSAFLLAGNDHRAAAPYSLDFLKNTNSTTNISCLSNQDTLSDGVATEFGTLHILQTE